MDLLIDNIMSMESFPNEIDMKLTSRNDGWLVVRSSPTNEEELKQWIQEFSLVSNTNWIVKRCAKDPVRFICRKLYLCHQNKKNKTAKKRSTDCKAIVDAKVKLLTSRTSHGDTWLKRKPPLCAIVKIKNDHNHNLSVPEALKLLRISPDVARGFETYFDDGLSPATAMKLHAEKLALLDDSHLLLSNGAVNPIYSSIYNLYKKWKKQNIPPPDLLKVMEDKALIYSETGTFIKVQNELPHWAILIATPIMQRAQSLKESQNVIFCDSTTTWDKTKKSITILLTVTKTGAIPIGILIHPTQSTESFIAAFSLFKQCFPYGFGSADRPQVFITDDTLAERNALYDVWPGATLLICSFHVAQAEWRWIIAKKNGIASNDRVRLMEEFQEVLYADSESDISTAVDKVQREGVLYPHFVKHFEAVFSRRKEWVLLDRETFLIWDSNIINFAEISIHILKDVIIDRANNIVAFTDFIINVFEKHLERNLLEFAHGRRPGVLTYWKDIRNKMTIIYSDTLGKIGENLYTVKSDYKNAVLANEDMKYVVNTAVGMCTCYNGKNGAFCKHQAFVHEELNVSVAIASSLSSNERCGIAELALGKACTTDFLIDKSEFAETDNMNSMAETMDIESYDSVPPDVEGDLIALEDGSVVFREESTPIKNESFPSEYESVLFRDESTPFENEPVPSGYVSVLFRDESVPSGDESVPSGDELVPSGDESVPSRDESVPSRNESVPSDSYIPTTRNVRDIKEFAEAVLSHTASILGDPLSEDFPTSIVQNFLNELYSLTTRDQILNIMSAGTFMMRTVKNQNAKTLTKPVSSPRHSITSKKSQLPSIDEVPCRKVAKKSCQSTIHHPS